MNTRWTRPLAALAFVWVSCFPDAQSTGFQQADVVSPALTKDYSGKKVAENLQTRFKDTRYDCGKNKAGHPHPAFLCSGILMRSTSSSPTYFSWTPSPKTAAWGVSFSWLRQDSNFPENYPSANGFIVYPWFDYPAGKGYAQLVVRCIFPQDAWTGAPDRCATDRTIPVANRPKSTTQKICQDQGIYSDKTWMAKFTNDEKQCAFGVEDWRQTNTAEAWQQAVDVRKKMNIFVRNEVIVTAWPKDVGARMPVEAFFYRDNCFYTDKDCGKVTPVADRLSRSDAIRKRIGAAKSDQEAFANEANRWVPIIRWTPATEIDGPATFEYIKDDQAVLQPPDPPTP